MKISEEIYVEQYGYENTLRLLEAIAKLTNEVTENGKKIKKLECFVEGIFDDGYNTKSNMGVIVALVE